MTLPSVIIDIGAKERVAGLAYVTISRGGKLSDLMIESATLDRLNAVKKIQHRLDEERRLDGICESTITRFRDINKKFSCNLQHIT